MKNKLFISAFILGLIALINVTSASAQCNSFAKKKCVPTLAPYTHNGQLNSTSLAPGETAELAMTFYSGQNYRLIVCAQPILEGVYFKLKDHEHKEIYSSKDKESLFDFNVKSTQQLFIEVVVPEAKKGAGDITAAGCVSVLVGFKQ